MELFKFALILLILAAVNDQYLISASAKTEDIVNGDFESNLNEWPPMFIMKHMGTLQLQQVLNTQVLRA